MINLTTVSKDWSEAERLRVIQGLAGPLCRGTQDFANRGQAILFVSSMPAEWLESFRPELSKFLTPATA